MLKKAFLNGLLLFGIFFGAANLIFPPTVGFLAKGNFVPAIIGFLVSGVGIPILTLIIGSFNVGGYKSEIKEKFGKYFSIIFLSILYLSIGPFFAIPRTAALSFDIGISQILSQNKLTSIIFTGIYFGLALILAYKKNSLLNHVGKILTPIFALLIISIICIGVLKFPSGSNNILDMSTGENSAFATGFLQGFNTLDALAAVAFSIISLKTLRHFGFSNKKEYIQASWISGIIVGVFFSLLYTGLALLGNRMQIPYLPNSVNIGVYVLSNSSDNIFGNFGVIFLAIMTTLTCFTTCVGLIVAVSEYFNSIYKKISYQQYVVLFTIIGFIISNFGLNEIIKFTVPVLVLLYPITITIVVLILLNKFFPMSKIAMNISLYIVAIISLASLVSGIFNIPILSRLLMLIPLANYSVAWLVPMLLSLILNFIFTDRKRGEPLDFSCFNQTHTSK